MRSALGVVLAGLVVSCTGSLENEKGASGGTPGQGGSSGVGGTNAGTSMGGGSSATGGASGTGQTGGASGTGQTGGASGTNATGGAGVTGGTGGTGGASGTGGTGALPSTLGGRITKSSVTVSAGVKAGVRNWSIWKQRNLVVSPVFTAPLANCQTLVCYTSGTATAPVAHVVRLTPEDTLESELVTEDGFECRGLAAGDGGAFGVLLWNDEANADPPLDTIAVKRYGADGMAVGTTMLVNDDNHPTDFGIGESRLAFGNGRYGAYYHVHSLSGHEGDTLKWVDAASGAETTQWDWGCSHSMSNVLRYNAGANAFINACITDCYPGTSGSNFPTDAIGGIYLNNRTKIMDVDAGCNGSVAGELGSAALSPNGYKLIFNAHQAAAAHGEDSYDDATMNQDIGFASVTGATMPGSVVWLTTTPDIDEMDSSISLYQPTGSPEQYLVGWTEGDGGVNKLAIVDAAGAFVEAPLDVSAQVHWGRRDDPFRQHYDGDVVWAWFDQANSTTLNFARVDSGVAYACQ